MRPASIFTENLAFGSKMTCTSLKTKRSYSPRKAHRSRTHSRSSRTELTLGSLHLESPHPPQQRCRSFGLEHHRSLLILPGIDARASLKLRQHLPLFLRNTKPDATWPIVDKKGIATLKWGSQADCLCRRNVDGLVIVKHIVVEQITVPQRLPLLGQQ